MLGRVQRRHALIPRLRHPIEQRRKICRLRRRHRPRQLQDQRLRIPRDAVERARRGEGPTLIESKTYRIRGHSRSDRNRYRTKEEIESWQARDPIEAFEKELLQLGLIEESQARVLEAEVEREIEAAIAFADASPAPPVTDLTRYVYST